MKFLQFADFNIMSGFVKFVVSVLSEHPSLGALSRVAVAVMKARKKSHEPIVERVGKTEANLEQMEIGRTKAKA